MNPRRDDRHSHSPDGTSGEYSMCIIPADYDRRIDSILAARWAMPALKHGDLAIGIDISDGLAFRWEVPWETLVGLHEGMTEAELSADDLSWLAKHGFKADYRQNHRYELCRTIVEFALTAPQEFPVESLADILCSSVCFLLVEDAEVRPHIREPLRQGVLGYRLSRNTSGAFQYKLVADFSSGIPGIPKNRRQLVIVDDGFRPVNERVGARWAEAQPSDPTKVVIGLELDGWRSIRWEMTWAEIDESAHQGFGPLLEQAAGAADRMIDEHAAEVAMLFAMCKPDFDLAAYGDLLCSAVCFLLANDNGIGRVRNDRKLDISMLGFRIGPSEVHSDRYSIDLIMRLRE